MQRSTSKIGNKGQLNRIALIARVQLAYEQVSDAMERLRAGAPDARTAVASARRRFKLLNRALAMVALQTAAA